MSWEIRLSRHWNAASRTITKTTKTVPALPNSSLGETISVVAGLDKRVEEFNESMTKFKDYIDRFAKEENFTILPSGILLIQINFISSYNQKLKCCSDLYINTEHRNRMCGGFYWEVSVGLRGR